ncbi:hypothetical protein [Caulobacter sp. 1776]|uniref:hypothetical protein n=1 Tax=Caulobacter sp. 1776 TaxID=3156420 RepID=UPI003392CF3B
MAKAPDGARRWLMAAGLGLLVPGGNAWSQSAEPAKARFKGETLALVIGYQSGSGTLTFQGRRHAFRLSGVSAVGLGAERVEGTAEVRHLTAIEDFEGLYWGVGAGGTLILGRGRATLRNAKGVEITLALEGRGIGLTLAAGGARIVLG